ncbi:putative Transcriptional regulator, TetR family [Bradyrhizobium sp. STM 3843]|uniref:TetR/AcrR family transcriptional regulator n=1 Tax=Bradyrhizobium sp. STM 3843 TaxID=551947 RepID=UPI0002403075|nr:TetR/AcrR family transcriptional regulator [Bradyrhizobium sp. STM 3843]CCE08842.1 putative Transcriptional regulator, TetR family [Bradyrhizobium sp. STM 3843]
MPRRAATKRTTFRHGNLPDALIKAAIRRIEEHGGGSITLRDLAQDTGVNHRAIYRHFPDKEALLAEVAERIWRDFIHHLGKAVANEAPGEAMLVAAGLAVFTFGRKNSNIFLFATGAYPSLGVRFPRLEAAITEALQIFVVGFAGTGIAPNLVVARAGVYIASMQGLTAQYLYGRLRVAPDKANAWMRDTCHLLIKGLAEHGFG